MKTFKGTLEEIMGVEKKVNYANNEVVKQSFLILRAFNSYTIEATHFLLAILKVAPNSLAVQYLETIQSKHEWKNQWQSRLLKGNIEKHNSSPPKMNLTFFIKTLKTMYFEKELLKCKDIDENCIFLALLRYQDFDGMIYKDALQFIKKNLLNP